VRQVTLRLPDDLADQVGAAARERGESVNGYAASVLRAAVDPRYAGDDVARLRERLARAGVLAPAPATAATPPDRDALARARAAAGRGRALADLVSEGRD